MNSILDNAKEGDLFCEFYAGIFRVWIKTKSGEWVRIMSRRKADAYEKTCEYALVGGHYDCESTEITYKTNTEHVLCMQHALMWIGLVPLHSEDDGLIRSVNSDA